MGDEKLQKRQAIKSHDESKYLAAYTPPHLAGNGDLTTDSASRALACLREVSMHLCTALWALVMKQLRAAFGWICITAGWALILDQASNAQTFDKQSRSRSCFLPSL